MRILHMFLDEKFFDSVSDFFDNIHNVENFYYFLNKNNCPIRYIKQLEKVRIFHTEKEYYNAICRLDADIIYLHSLSPSFYKYILRLPKTVKVICWAWGYDLYYPWKGCKPFIPLSLYKDSTKSYMISSSQRTLKQKVRGLYYKLSYIYHLAVRNKVLARIDYFTPVISTEYNFMLNNRHFKAKPFMLRIGPGEVNVSSEPIVHTKAENIIIGNSLTLSNNHLDVWEYIKKCKILKNQSYIIPISYGDDISADFLKRVIESDNIIWLEDFLPLQEYRKIQSTISHAVFGVIRQQAMGNIFYCLRSGVKVFLFKDSIIFKYLVSVGYIVYSIEEVDDNSFTTPLDKQSALHNYNIEMSRSADSVQYAESELKRIFDSDKL